MLELLIAAFIIQHFTNNKGFFLSERIWAFLWWKTYSLLFISFCFEFSSLLTSFILRSENFEERTSSLKCLPLPSKKKKKKIGLCIYFNIFIVCLFNSMQFHSTLKASHDNMWLRDDSNLFQKQENVTLKKNSPALKISSGVVPPASLKGGFVMVIQTVSMELTKTALCTIVLHLNPVKTTSSDVTTGDASIKSGFVITIMIVGMDLMNQRTAVSFY